MKLYKLTDENGQTRNGTQWGPGVTHMATGDATQDLCSNGWIHAYEKPWVGLIMNSNHANFKKPRLFEAEGASELKRDGQLKCGVPSLTTVRELKLPSITTEQRVEFAIRCSLEVYKDAGFKAWAEGWISGADRSSAAAAAATAAYTSANAANAAAYTAANAAYAAYAAYAAATAANAAANIDLYAIALQVFGEFVDEAL